MSVTASDVAQPPASAMVNTFAGVVQGVRGKVALFNRSARSLEINPDLSPTFTKTPDQLADTIAEFEGSTLRRADIVGAQLPEYYAARDALDAEDLTL